MIIHTRFIKEAKPGDLAIYRWGSLRKFADGRIFAPSGGLLANYKDGGLSWEAYERHYLAEMESLYQRSPGYSWNSFSGKRSHWSATKRSRISAIGGCWLNFWPGSERRMKSRLCWISSRNFAQEE